MNVDDNAFRIIFFILNFHTYTSSIIGICISVPFKSKITTSKLIAASIYTARYCLDTFKKFIHIQILNPQFILFSFKKY